jgi:hypothetical protein
MASCSGVGAGAACPASRIVPDRTSTSTTNLQVIFNIGNLPNFSVKHFIGSKRQSASAEEKTVIICKSCWDVIMCFSLRKALITGMLK